MKLTFILTMALLSLAACTLPVKVKGREKGPRVGLPEGALIVVRIAPPEGVKISRAEVGELVLCALEQCPSRDFLVLLDKDGVGPKKAGAYVTIRLDASPAQANRPRLQALVAKEPGQVLATCQALPREPDFKGLLRGVDSLALVLRRTLGESKARISADYHPLARCCTGNPDALRTLALARQFALRGEIKQAHQALNQTLKHDRRCGRAMLFKASLLLESRNRSQALLTLENARFATKEMSTLDNHRLTRLRLRATDQHAELMAEAERFLELAPANAEGRFTLALALNRLGKFRRAEKIWQTLHERRPAALTPLFQLGLALFGQRKYEAAQASWDGLADRGAGEMEALFFAVLPRYAAGNKQTGYKLLEASLARSRDSANQRTRIGQLLCAAAVMGRNVALAEQHALKIIADSKFAPLATLAQWRRAAQFLIYREKYAPVIQYLKQLPRDNFSSLRPMRLTAIWLQGLIAAKRSPDTLTGKAISNLSQAGWQNEAGQIKAHLARARNNPTALIFVHREAFSRRPTRWHQFLLGQALIEFGDGNVGRKLLQELVTKGYRLDQDDPGDNPLANPLSAVALLEAIRLVERTKKPR